METSSEVTSSERFMGRVKWFNNKAGYGFITVTDGAKAGTDIFAHHSGVMVDVEQYRYLVQGEYVEFKLDDTPEGVHKFQAADISGIKGGKLMCETRHENRDNRMSFNEEAQETDTSQPKSMRAPRESVDAKEWTMTPTSTNKTGGRGAGRGGRGANRAGRGSAPESK